MIKIAIAEDHDLVREGLVSLFEDEINIEVCLSVRNGAELLNGLLEEQVDVVLLDLDMPVLSGLQALEILKRDYPHISVLIISMFYENDFISRSMKLGARGFLPKNSSIETVIEAIHSVVDQGYYFDDKISKELIFRLINNHEIEPVLGTEPLSEREVEIVKHICNEKTNKEIADDLHISIRTVEVHRKTISQKTNARNTAGVVIYAIKNGLFSI